jgi:hypothetical protein
MTYRRRRTVRVAAAAAFLSATFGLTVSSASPSQAAACSQTQYSTMYLKGTASQYEYVTYVNRSGQVSVSRPYYYRQNVDTGYVAVSVLACKEARTKRWIPLSYAVGHIQKDLDLLVSAGVVSPRPRVRDRGFGVFVNRVTAGAVEVDSVVCTSRPQRSAALGVARLLSTLPLPGPSWIGIAQAIAGAKLPAGKDVYSCGAIGSAAVPWRFDAAGTARLALPGTGHYLHSGTGSWTASSCPPSYRDCAVSHRQAIEVRAGR